MKKILMIFVVLLSFESTVAKAISWGDVSDAWNHATDEVTNFFEKLKGDIEKLGAKINSLVSEVDDIHLRTPKIDFKDIGDRIKIPKERFNLPEFRYDRLGSSLENFKIGGELGKIAQAIKYHWGPEIDKCIGKGHWVTDLCNYKVCKLDKSLTWGNDDVPDKWKCDLKIAQKEQDDLKDTLNGNLGEIGSQIDVKKENLSNKIKPFMD